MCFDILRALVRRRGILHESMMNVFKREGRNGCGTGANRSARAKEKRGPGNRRPLFGFQTMGTGAGGAAAHGGDVFPAQPGAVLFRARSLFDLLPDSADGGGRKSFGGVAGPGRGPGVSGRLGNGLGRGPVRDLRAVPGASIDPGMETKLGDGADGRAAAGPGAAGHAFRPGRADGDPAFGGRAAGRGADARAAAGGEDRAGQAAENQSGRFTVPAAAAAFGVFRGGALVPGPGQSGLFRRRMGHAHRFLAAGQRVGRVPGAGVRARPADRGTKRPAAGELSFRRAAGGHDAGEAAGVGGGDVSAFFGDGGLSDRVPVHPRFLRGGAAIRTNIWKSSIPIFPSVPASARSRNC